MWNDQQYEAFRLRGYLIQKEARAKIENSGPGNYVIVRRINVTLTIPAPATTASETVCLAAPIAGDSGQSRAVLGSHDHADILCHAHRLACPREFVNPVFASVH